MRMICMKAICVVVVGVYGLVSCSTPGSDRETSLPAYYENEILIVTARHIPVSQLSDRYRRPNPFTAPLMLITPFELMTFDVGITSVQSNLRIKRGDMQFRFEGVRGRVLGELALTNIWETFITDDDDPANLILRGNRLIQQSLLSSTINLSEPNETRIGLVIIRGRFPESGRAELVVPYRIENGDEMQEGEAILTFQF